MSDKKIDESMIEQIDEAEATTYRQIFGIFNKDDGDFVQVNLEKKPEAEKGAKPKTERKKAARKTKTEIKDEVEQILNALSEKDISSMVIKIKINGKQEEYVNDQKAGTKFLSKEDQIEKIKEVIKGFKNIVVVHSEEELLKLQDEYNKKLDKSKANEQKKKDIKMDAEKPAEEKHKEDKTQVYIRISEKDYGDVKSFIEAGNIKIFASKVKMRDDKTGINIVMKKEDLDKVKDILIENKINVLQEVEGNVNWNDIKSNSKEFKSINTEQLKEFQSKNQDKYNYIAFRKGNEYTVYADNACDIGIGVAEKKTIKQVDSSIKEYRNNESTQKPEKAVKEKSKNSKEVAR